MDIINEKPDHENSLHADQLHIVWDENGNVLQDEVGNIMLMPEIKPARATRKRSKNEK
ncbi:MAG TPA: hypothetical protein PK816_03700 [Candidatus Cloacimonadota bacterium]|nr:hypothetical protein [Candidatus Cloacimonadota bacterium]